MVEVWWGAGSSFGSMGCVHHTQGGRGPWSDQCRHAG
jgi:hypothetical protein